MKTLADRGVLYATVARLETISTDRPPLWGAMSASQMLAHLDGAFRMATLDLPVRPCQLPFAPIARFVILHSGLSLPKKVQTISELDLRGKPEVPGDFSSCRIRLIERIWAFPELAPDALLPAHPMLGTISHWEWMRWAYLHTDHHLRQFGC